jgi:hypothetical protein
MNQLLEQWSRQDLRFVVETLVPERSDAEHLIDLLGDDDGLLEAMLEDERLFRQLMEDEEILMSVSPSLFFKVLLLRARHDLEREIYTIERRQQQRVILFDANRVVDLLARPDVCNYLATMLASFTRVHSTTIPIRVRPGIWHRLKVNDLDVDSLMRYAQFLEEERRFAVYRRIGDACLFLSGLFPEYIGAGQSFPQSRQPRLRLKSSLFHGPEEFESFGRTFYRAASKHPQARMEGLDGVLGVLAEQFLLAEKPLAFLAERYLSLRKHRFFKW